ncbi:MAG: helix-turn-helix transcriptional regulator [Eubacteriales bacterium]|nr:helix-turn-helix transcriptional regulator [Eubacteriales bacterium]
MIERLKTFGFSDVAEATVYPILTRLENKGELRFEKKASRLGPPRKYYELTQKRKQAFSQFEQNWGLTQRIVGKVLEQSAK